MDINELQKHWNEFGRRDPLWAILTDSARQGGKWNRDEFFQTGQKEIAAIMQVIDTLGVGRPHERCLDFGCGVGRLTQALCDYFEQCDGVDIAPSMIDLANQYNRHPDRCKYHVNSADNLKIFGDNSFDFVYTSIVLQHIAPEYSKKYLAEFLRVLRPGGLLIFQVPSEYQSFLDRYRLTESAFKANISLQQKQLRISPGAEMNLKVHVKNTSDTTWPANLPTDGTCAIRLGNHWLDLNGNVLINDDGRAVLPHDLKPLQEATMALTITAPQKPGEYLLEFDLVQEGVAWFKQRGSPTTIVPVKNAESALASLTSRLFGGKRQAGESGSAQEQAEFTPVMQMNAIPRDEVVAVVQQHGGHMLAIHDDFSCGREWVSFRYFVSK